MKVVYPLQNLKPLVNSWCDEDLFKIITKVNEFNNIKWQQLRYFLLKCCVKQDITNKIDAILGKKKSFENGIKNLNKKLKVSSKYFYQDKHIDFLNKKIEFLRKEWHKENICKSYIEQEASIFKEIKILVESLPKKGEDKKYLHSCIAAAEKDVMRLDEKFETIIINSEKDISKLSESLNFKLFIETIGGVTQQCCTPVYNGVDYKDLNTASKINAGVEIIGVLSKHFNISVPLFIDGAESVTEINEIDTQVIKLCVNPEEKELKISKL